MTKTEEKPLFKLHFYKCIYYILAIIVTLLEIYYSDSDLNSQIIIIGMFTASFFIDQKLKYPITTMSRITKFIGEYFSFFFLVALVLIFIYNTYTDISDIFNNNIWILFVTFSVIFVIQTFDWLTYGRSEQENKAYNAGIQAAKESKEQHKRAAEEAEQEIKSGTRKFISQKDRPKVDKKRRRQNNI